MKSENSKAHQHVPVGPDDAWAGQDFKRVITAGSVWLARNLEGINALNVFPVPDGDTGTNMALTMQAAVKQVEELSEPFRCRDCQVDLIRRSYGRAWQLRCHPFTDSARLCRERGKQGAHSRR